jgi:cyclophilin family peptidyl-prolyl cis-trans isomerase
MRVILLLAAPALVAAQSPPARFHVEIETSRGAFVVEVNRDWAPRGADRFHELVRTGYFDDSRFFRVREKFIAQFGIPGKPERARLEGSGHPDHAGNPSSPRVSLIASDWRLRRMEDDPVKRENRRGTIAYAMTGPGTRTTQLFISLVDNLQLDAQGFAPIGRVVAGMDVVDSLYAGYDEKAGGGMRGGKQDSLFASGNRYLDAHFPKLDRLIRARIVRD